MNDTPEYVAAGGAAFMILIAAVCAPFVLAALWLVWFLAH